MTLYKKPFETIVGKGEMLTTINFSFSHNVLHVVKDRFFFFFLLHLSTTAHFSLEESKIFVVWERVKELKNGFNP